MWGHSEPEICFCSTKKTTWDPLPNSNVTPYASPVLSLYCVDNTSSVRIRDVNLSREAWHVIVSNLAQLTSMLYWVNINWIFFLGLSEVGHLIYRLKSVQVGLN